MVKENENKIPLKDHWFLGTFIKNRAVYIQVFIASIFINIFGFVSAFYIMTVYDRVLPNYAMGSLLALTIGMSVVIIFDFILKMLRAYFSDVAGNDLDVSISEKLINKLLSHDDKVIESPSKVVSNIREFDSVKDFFTSASLLALVDLPFMFLFIGVIASIGGYIAIVPILIVPLVLGVAGLVQPFLKRFSAKDMEMRQGKVGVLTELTHNLESVRTVAGGNFLKNRWRSSVEDQGKSSLLARMTTNVATTFGQTGLQVSQMGIIVYGVILISSQSMSTGALIACVILSGRTLSPLVQAAQLLTRLNMAITAYKNVDTLMKQEARDEKTISKLAVEIDKAPVEIKNLSLNLGDSKILEDISLSIKDGEKVGIVGALGSGKSSLIKSIIGYHLPEIGAVKIGNYDINNIPSDILRTKIGYCPQNIQLFSGSIYENITAGFEDVTEADVLEAATMSGAAKFIGNLNGGFNYFLKENGMNLSGGQRQTISLARAFLRKPKLLILDEPTSAMDSDTENNIMNQIFNLPYKPTIVMITHKIQHLMNMDKIAIILQGKVARFGPKDEVIKQQENNA